MILKETRDPSDASASITGQVIQVDGGLSI